MDPDFNQWYVSTGGLTGNDPTQQPTERVMEKDKGTKGFPGMLNVGRNRGTMIEVELPKMIVNVSTTCMGVESHTWLYSYWQFYVNKYALNAYLSIFKYSLVRQKVSEKFLKIKQ